MEKQAYIIIHIKSKDGIDFDADLSLEGNHHDLSQAFASVLMTYPPFQDIVLEAIANIFSGYRPNLKDLRPAENKKI